ncbi:MAG: hypothetical protein IKN32_01050 [Bacteroidales bacterium]|nr:hypothetical protein [Bacteroidales bacterium]
MSNVSARRHIKEGRKVIVADLYKRGWSISKIASEVRARMETTCSTRTVWNDIQELLEEWRATRINDVDQRLQLELERIDDAVCELWDQWDKSKEDWVREFNKRIGVPVPAGGGSDDSDGEGEASIVTVKRENRTQNVVGLGNPAYIAEIRQQLMERRKLLGLYAATKTEVTGKDGSPLIPAEKMTEEEILAEIEKIRQSRGH